MSLLIALSLSVQAETPPEPSAQSAVVVVQRSMGAPAVQLEFVREDGLVVGRPCESAECAVLLPIGHWDVVVVGPTGFVGSADQEVDLFPHQTVFLSVGQ